MWRKRTLLIIIIVPLWVSQTFGWGLNGHRIVGQLAEWHLNKKAKRNIDAILGHQTLPMVGNWMDEIRSDPRYNHTHTWHYLTVEDGKDYDPTIQEKGGDAYERLLKIISALKSGQLSEEDERENLKMLVHLVGDLHQPLHVGRGDDRGGNDIKLYYFNRQSNLHRVWDSDMIEGKNLSFTEMASYLNKRANKGTVTKLQAVAPSVWLKEAQELRPMVYDIPANNRLFYAYDYKYFNIIEDRLLAAGIRLAGILNDIYG